MHLFSFVIVLSMVIVARPDVLGEVFFANDTSSDYGYAGFVEAEDLEDGDVEIIDGGEVNQLVGMSRITVRPSSAIDMEYAKLIKEFDEKHGEYSRNIVKPFKCANPLNNEISTIVNFTIHTGTEHFIFSKEVVSALGLKVGGSCKSKTASGE